jgi:hypothetical protein
MTFPWVSEPGDRFVRCGGPGLAKELCEGLKGEHATRFLTFEEYRTQEEGWEGD